MSCKISRRNFMRCAGIGALALASTSLLGGCTTFDAEYGLNDAVTFTDKNGGSLTLSITRAVEIAAGSHEDMAKDYRLNIDETQRYVYLHMEVVNNTGEEIELYNKRYTLDWLEGSYTDEKIRELFYEPNNDEDLPDGTRTTYPNANNVVRAPTVFWAYNNGMYLNDGKFGAVCYTGTAGEPREVNTYAQIPTGSSYIDCIGQITENLQTLRVVYRTAGKEVNFVIYPSEFQ